MYYRKYSGIPSKTQVMAENTMTDENNMPMENVQNDNMSDNKMQNGNSEMLPNDNARQGNCDGNNSPEMPSDNARQGGSNNPEMPTENTETAPLQENAENSPYSGSINSGFQNDFELMQATYTAINKALLPYVKVIVAEYAYEGSPALRDIGPDKEYISQMVIRILELAQNDIDDIEEIRLDSIREPWNDLQLLYNIAEALVLAEIYFIKRKNK